MATNNHERVGRGLEILTRGLRPFVDRYFGGNAPNGDWTAMLQARDEQRNGISKPLSANDPSVLLRVLTEEWRSFKDKLSRPQQALASELRETRNIWAHDGSRSMSSDDAYRALDTIERLLRAVDAPEEADEVRELRMNLQRSAYDSRARKASRTIQAASVDGKGLKPWREVITPHADVVSGDLPASEFAADLHWVAQGEGAAEYVDPIEFFRRTYLTTGLQDLLTRAVKRIGGDANASPIVNLQTNFGGGKTHSMLALYHLFSSHALTDFPQELQEVAEADPEAVQQPVNRVVLVGNHLTPGKADVKPDGTHVNTLWGELAWQLGGREAFDVVAQADATKTNPGADLRTLLQRYGPCLILIDEWVSYARQLYADDSLPAGSFDTQFTFAQTLTETVGGVPGAMLVISIPASHRSDDADTAGSGLEVGGEHGQRALERLQNVTRRVADQWRPATSEESFEIVRRRLFDETDADARNEIAAIARTYVDFYKNHRGEFPSETTEPDYERRIAAAYPVHPELFDRLYGDWSTLDRFQRTRGVLRLMSNVIHELWQAGDTSPMILPGTVPLDRPRVLDELAQYLDDAWKPIVDTDIDGPDSTPVRIDQQRTVLGARFFTRRTARSIFVGSAPTLRSAQQGLEVQHVRLGTAIPGDTVGNFGQALQLLTDRSTYLYVDQQRYWYDTHPSVTRTARDYAERLTDDDVWVEVERRLKPAERRKGSFHAVHAAPESSADVRDTDDARLVIIGPRYPHDPKAESSAALEFADRCLKTKGTSNRVNRNMITFLAPTQRDLTGVDQAVRDYLAWQNIWERADSELNLTAQQKTQAQRRMDAAGQTAENRISEAWQILIRPDQPDPARPATLITSRCSGSEQLADRAGQALKRQDALITELGPNVIRHAVLTNTPSVWESGHVSVGEVWDLCRQYAYMPRLADRTVLDGAVRAVLGMLTWHREGFALATGYDKAADTYQGLAIPHEDDSAQVSDSTLLIKPEVASAQREQDQAEATDETEAAGPNARDPQADIHRPTELAVEVVRNAEFHGVQRLDPERYGRDWSKLADEVLSHLANADGVDLEITVDVRAHASSGIPDDKARTVAENAKVLKFEVSRFEDGTSQ